MKISGKTLRIWRTMKMIKQVAIAKDLNISQQGYSKWESKDVISSLYLKRFFSATNCTREELDAIEKMHTPDKLTALLRKSGLFDEL
jgi:predicted transcriptional regulator